MLVRELKRQLEQFHGELTRHRDLWNKSLESGVPDYPITNIKTLQSQTRSLLRQLGRLRPYMEELHSSWILAGGGVSWNILDLAIGLGHTAQAKGPSLNALVDAVQIILGRLDDYADEEEFRIGTFATVNSDIELAEKVCSRVGKTARVLSARRRGKEPFVMADEYDVQDLLHSLLRAFFKYPVAENPVPKSGSGFGQSRPFDRRTRIDCRSEVCQGGLKIKAELKRSWLRILFFIRHGRL